MSPRVLCAGIGNVFFSDDGFGVAVADRLKRMSVPDGVVVEDYGIRGVHLAYELLDGYDALVLIDTLPPGDEPPGTVVVFEPDSTPTEAGGDVAPAMDAHTMTPVAVLTTLASLGGSVERVVVVGCRPATIEGGMGLSEPVAGAIDRAVETVIELLIELVGNRPTDVCQPAGRESRT
jgi:hydrogenase maturation protease